MQSRSWCKWFEIPAPDFDRAVRFYQTIFDVELQVLDMGAFKLAIFPDAGASGGGALAHHPKAYQPSETHGPLVYFDGNPDLSAVLDRVEAAGGRVLRGKTQISDEFGYMAIFVDSEGNRVALHSDR
jgi:predicted enzyme related to lactoylglutathione lyase